MYVDGWRDALKEVGRRIGQLSAHSPQCKELQASALETAKELMLQPGIGRLDDFTGSRKDLLQPPESLDVEAKDCDRSLHHAGHYWQPLQPDAPGPYYCRGVGLQARENARLLDLTAYREKLGRKHPN